MVWEAVDIGGGCGNEGLGSEGFCNFAERDCDVNLQSMLLLKTASSDGAPPKVRQRPQSRGLPTSQSEASIAGVLANEMVPMPGQAVGSIAASSRAADSHSRPQVRCVCVYFSQSARCLTTVNTVCIRIFS